MFRFRALRLKPEWLSRQPNGDSSFRRCLLPGIHALRTGWTRMSNSHTKPESRWFGGESTWSSCEPRDGRFQIAWIERVLDRLQTAGIQVILGRPTYSIPTWLYKQHPEIVVTHNETTALSFELFWRAAIRSILPSEWLRSSDQILQSGKIKCSSFVLGIWQ